MFLRSLKLTVKAALWGIFSIATVVTVIIAFGGDGLNLKSHPRAHLYWRVVVLNSEHNRFTVINSAGVCFLHCCNDLAECLSG